MHISAGTALFVTVLVANSCGRVEPGVTAFSESVNAYARIRDQVRSQVGTLPQAASAEEIENHGRTLVNAIRTARSNARQGDIFVAEARPSFVAILNTHLSGSENGPTRTSARQGNPERQQEPGATMPQVQVNAVYPASAPLSTVPPNLLAALPKLPKDIDYRFCGQSLLLVDTESNLIIDYIEGAAPSL